MITVDDSPMEWEEGMTVAELVEIRGETRHCAVVRMNGKLVSSPKFSTTRVPDGAVVYLLPLVAGG